MDGFDVSEKLHEINDNVIIVFVTCHDSKVYQVWEHRPFWFIRKSHTDELEIMLPKLISRIERERRKKHCVCNLVGENSVTDVDLNKLVTIECQGHDIVIRYDDNSVKRLRCKISDAEIQLKDLFVVRVQNGILVNLRFVSRVTSREVIMHNGQNIALGRKRIEFVKKEFLRSMRGF